MKNTFWEIVNRELINRTHSAFFEFWGIQLPFYLPFFVKAFERLNELPEARDKVVGSIVQEMQRLVQDASEKLSSGEVPQTNTNEQELEEERQKEGITELPLRSKAYHSLRIALGLSLCDCLERLLQCGIPFPLGFRLGRRLLEEDIKVHIDFSRRRFRMDQEENAQRPDPP